LRLLRRKISRSHIVLLGAKETGELGVNFSGPGAVFLLQTSRGRTRGGDRGRSPRERLSCVVGARSEMNMNQFEL
jgi:hypothetical protein